MKYTKIPAITGYQLIRLLEKGGWLTKGKTKHGIAMYKRIGDRNVVTIIQRTRAPLPEGTLMAILGYKQTRIGKKGLLKLLDKHVI